MYARAGPTEGLGGARGGGDILPTLVAMGLTDLSKNEGEGEHQLPLVPTATLK